MVVCVWERVSDCGSGRYHPGGGVVIVAESEAAAYARFVEVTGVGAPEATAVYSTTEAETRAFIFPDSGCC